MGCAPWWAPARQAMFNDLAEALKAGKLQGAHDHIVRTPLVLDADGQRNVQAIAERATKEVENEQRATAKRREKTNGDGGEVVGYTFALLAFEAAWETADLHALVAQVEGEASASANGANGAGQNGGGARGAGAKWWGRQGSRSAPGTWGTAGPLRPSASRPQTLLRAHMTNAGTSPKYDVAIVEAVLLEVAAELHPQSLTAKELALRIISDADDTREVETAARAIRNLRKFGLFSDRDDETVVPTPAGLRAVALLT